MSYDIKKDLSYVAIALVVILISIIFAWLIYKRCVSNINTKKNKVTIPSDDRSSSVVENVGDVPVTQQDKECSVIAPTPRSTVNTFENVESRAEQTQGKLIHASVLEKFCGENPEEVYCEHPVFLRLINSESLKHGIPEYIYKQHHSAIKCALEGGNDDYSVMVNSSVGQGKQVKAIVVYNSLFDLHL